MRKRLTILLMLVCILGGCAQTPREPTQVALEEQPKNTVVYTTFAPMYLLASAVAGGIADVELHNLVPPQDGCLRNYTLTDRDIALLQTSASGILSFGCGMEAFESTLEAICEDNLWYIQALEGAPLLSGASVDEDEENHLAGDNPYVYLSAARSADLIRAIGGGLSMTDPKNAAAYEKNADEAANTLKALHQSIQTKTHLYRMLKTAICNEALVYCAEEYRIAEYCTIRRESGEDFGEADWTACLSTLKENSVQLVLIEKQAPIKLINRLKSEGYSVVRMEVFSAFGEADTFEDYSTALYANAEAFSAAASAIKE